jgi:CO/xanthine dehydrogenase Mo-binding subunit
MAENGRIRVLLPGPTSYLGRRLMLKLLDRPEVRLRVLIDGGAYASSSTAVISNACSFAVGPYAVENVLVEGLAVYTNNPPCGAMRGFGAVQTCFAAEAQMDRLAAELGIDPVELRLLNALEPGGDSQRGRS